MTLLSASLPLDIRDSVMARSSAKRVPWHVKFDREIGEEDLILLASVFYEPADPRAPLANIRDPHHTLARLVAQDKPTVEVAAITGYSPARINTLRADPAFRELVAHYAEQERSAEADISQQIKHAALTSLSILQERLETEPDSFSNKELREIANSGLDRIGHGPQSKVDIRVTDQHKVIEQLSMALRQELGGRIISQDYIEAEYVETSQSDGAEIGDDDADWAVPTNETQGESAGGAEVSSPSVP